MNDDDRTPPTRRAQDPSGRASGDPAIGPHDPPPGARFMNAVRWVLFVGLVLLAAGSLAGYLASQGSGGRVASGAALYHCPMHPTYTSTDPDAECAICGMDLVPVAAEGAGAETGSGDVPGLTGVQLSPERIQMIGVRTAVAARRVLGRGPDLVGFVTPDESRLVRIQLRVSGWVRELFVNVTGGTVAAGQPLLAIYSPELYQSEREYLIERAAEHGGAHEHEAAAPAAARERLRLLGVPDEEIERLEREGTPETWLVLRSPVHGTVLERGATEGQYVGPDTPLLTVADFSRVWLLVDLYEMDLTRVRRGDRVSFVADALPGASFDGRIDLIYPTVSTETRTVKARVAVANPRGDLRPGMFGRARLSSGGAEVLAVPAEAVVNTGEHRYVFQARAGGHFEPRLVQAGAEAGDWIEIRGGLAVGDTVVASASFLVDSESRLKAAISGMGAPGSQAGAGSH
jgi:Cu(I)/Ag(I) efflux system membrane fusion protein